MRLFIGIDIPVTIADRLSATIETLRPSAPKLKWSPVSNLHITTKFIGTWPEQRLEELKQALADGIRAEPFDVLLSGLGWFPNPHSPRIFWASARGGEPLMKLAVSTDEVTSKLGVEKETKAYTPHLTLARVPPGVDLREIRGAVARLEDPGWGQFRADQFFLYRSEPTPAGSVYTKLAGFPLSV